MIEKDSLFFGIVNKQEEHFNKKKKDVGKKPTLLKQNF